MTSEFAEAIGTGLSTPTERDAASQFTLQEAADALNVSNSYLVSLIDDGDMPFSTSGGHRLIEAKDLFEYKRVRDGERAAALDDMARLDAEQGLL